MRLKRAGRPNCSMREREICRKRSCWLFNQNQKKLCSICGPLRQTRTLKEKVMGGIWSGSLSEPTEKSTRSGPCLIIRGTGPELKKNGKTFSKNKDFVLLAEKDISLENHSRFPAPWSS